MDDLDNDAFADVMEALEAEVGCNLDEDADDYSPLDFNEL